MKYKHKKTGKVVHPFHGETYIVQDEGSMFPAWIIEDSCDWEEVKESILITHDHYHLYEGDEYYTVFDKQPKYSEVSLWVVNGPFRANITSKLDKPSDEAKFFKTYKAAHDYSEKFKKVYSKQDILDAMDYVKTLNSMYPLLKLKEKLGL